MLRAVVAFRLIALGWMAILVASENSFALIESECQSRKGKKCHRITHLAASFSSLMYSR